jgi:hypothetical protein
MICKVHCTLYLPSATLACYLFWRTSLGYTRFTLPSLQQIRHLLHYKKVKGR